MGSFENFSQENPEVPVDLSDAKKDLEEKFKKKSFFERHFAEFQTRKVPIKGAENPEEMRGETFRFERGQILKAYKILREQIRDAQVSGEDATEGKNLLKEKTTENKVESPKVKTREEEIHIPSIDEKKDKDTIKTNHIALEEESSTIQDTETPPTPKKDSP